LKLLINPPGRNVILAADSQGRIFIWTHDPSVELVAQIDSKVISEIRGLNIVNNLLCVGQLDGTITMYDLGAPGKEKNIKEITSWGGKQGIRLVALRETPRRELITGDNTGIVTVWDIRSQQPVYVLQAHTDVITQMKWLEDKQMLVSLSKDKTLKVWRFPKTWIDESQVQQAVVPNYDEYADASDDASDDEKS
jgi:WD40 repeat protein